jgi:hypothetical protein
MKDPFLKPSATKDPFLNQTLTKDPFINTENAADARDGRKPTNPRVLPAIPSTWRSPITPCQGAQRNPG